MSNLSRSQSHWPKSFLAEIPELPSVIRYYDDFLDEFHSIQNPINDIWIIFDQGTKESLNFGAFEGGLRPLLKLWCCNQIQTLSIGTARTRFQRLRCIALDDLLLMLSSTPVSARSNWNVLMSHNYSARDMDALKSILYYFCKSCIAGWSTHYEKFLSTLPLPVYDKYASVRGGDVFLAVEEEAALVTHIDSINEKVVLSPQSIADDMLRHTAILLCAFQFGLRPMQIGMLRMRDVRIWTESDSSIASVHLTFKMIKQRSSSKAFPLPRRVKREWAPLFVELHARAQRSGMSATDHFFGVSSASETGSIITRMTAKLLAESRSATELRHTAAQRLVDAGANQEELAEFLGHSDIDTGLIYFQTSANQAERVNKALGISPIYQQVAKIAHARFIDKGELAELKGDRQIGAVPHGIPISGIGACAVGQPACPSNPVTACYGCIKFMPLNDPEIHKQVLADFRSVVTFFSEASMGDDNSPAYLQLRRTISNVQAIIEELEGKTDE